MHFNTERTGILHGADRYLPDDFTRLHIDRRQRAERRRLTRNAQRRHKAVFVDRVWRAFQRHRAHAGIDRFAAVAAARDFTGICRDHLHPQAETHIVDEHVLVVRIERHTAPVHTAEGTREAERLIGIRHGEQAVVAHRFKGDAARQLIERRRAPHVRLGQRLVADLRHLGRMRLRFGVLLVRDMALRHRQLFDFRQRLAGFAIQHENHAGFPADNHRWFGGAVFHREIDQARLHRQIEVPQIVMNGLVDPLLFARGRIQRQNGGAIFMVQFGAVRAPQIHRGAAHRDEYRVHRRIV